MEKGLQNKGKEKQPTEAEAGLHPSSVIEYEAWPGERLAEHVTTGCIVFPVFPLCFFLFLMLSFPFYDFPVATFVSTIVSFSFFFSFRYFYVFPCRFCLEQDGMPGARMKLIIRQCEAPVKTYKSRLISAWNHSVKWSIVVDQGSNMKKVSSKWILNVFSGF